MHQEGIISCSLTAQDVETHNHRRDNNIYDDEVVDVGSDEDEGMFSFCRNELNDGKCKSSFYVDGI